MPSGQGLGLRLSKCSPDRTYGIAGSCTAEERSQVEHHSMQLVEQNLRINQCVVVQQVEGCRRVAGD